jgi:HEAT repeat protein
MNFSIRRPSNSPPRRSSRCNIGVESMEGRALLTSAVVQGAIYQVQQTQVEAKDLIADEVLVLKSNILAIESTTNDFIAGAQSDILSQKQDILANPGDADADNAAIKADQLNIKNANRDEKFAIGQQNSLIKSLNTVEKQALALTNYNIIQLKKGTQDPTTISTVLGNESNYFQTRVSEIDAQATNDLNGLTITLASGTA